MKKKGFLYKLLFVLILCFCLYFYDDIEQYINVDSADDNIGNVVNESVGNLEIYYVDVGQADCILIRYLNKNVLIDAGNNEDGAKLVDYFKSLGVSGFDYVIATHAHEDHIGGMDDIINNFKIDHFYMPNVISTSRTFEDVLDSMETNGVEFEVPKDGDEFKIDNLSFYVLHVGDDQSNLNDTSIVLRMEYGKTSYLFMGDASSSVEKLILNKNIVSTVLKVGHHGSQYSSSAAFINKVHPQYAIIQVGVNNVYDHPRDVVIKKLEKVGAKIYRTDRDGTIILKSDGDNISFKFESTDTNGG